MMTRAWQWHACVLAISECTSQPSDNSVKLCRAGGKRVGDKGYIVEPTIFADVKDDMDIAKCEMSLHGTDMLA